MPGGRGGNGVGPRGCPVPAARAAAPADPVRASNCVEGRPVVLIPASVIETARDEGAGVGGTGWTARGAAGVATGPVTRAVLALATSGRVAR